MVSKLLHWWARRRIRAIADKYPMTRKDLVRYHDLVAIECINQETKGKERLLGIAAATAEMLDTDD